MAVRVVSFEVAASDGLKTSNWFNSFFCTKIRPIWGVCLNYCIKVKIDTVTAILKRLKEIFSQILFEFGFLIWIFLTFYRSIIFKACNLTLSTKLFEQSKFLSWFLAKNLAYAECWIMKFHYRNSSTANVYRVQGFQIYGDCHTV